MQRRAATFVFRRCFWKSLCSCWLRIELDKGCTKTITGGGKRAYFLPKKDFLGSLSAKCNRIINGESAVNILHSQEKQLLNCWTVSMDTLEIVPKCIKDWLFHGLLLLLLRSRKAESGHWYMEQEQWNKSVTLHYVTVASNWVKFMEIWWVQRVNQKQSGALSSGDFCLTKKTLKYEWKHLNLILGSTDCFMSEIKVIKPIETQTFIHILVWLARQLFTCVIVFNLVFIWATFF